ncbi:amidoligase family protein [Cytophagaceae bacterium ABcell3]|nr:amidoligase family protein [Cytophagaceae bacterium ABcell3]
MEFILPPVLNNAKGEIRKVGFELEFGKLDLNSVAACIQEIYGGELIKHNRFLQEIKDTSKGNFKLKIDTSFLTEKSYEKLLIKAGFNPSEGTVLQDIENLSEYFASAVVPYEIDTPPVPLTEMAEIDKLREALWKRNAQGTENSFIAAYATHINPEVPDQKVEVLLSYLKAFLLLYPWLFQTSKVNFTRRLTAFINPFTEDYISLVLKESYKPDLKTFAEDYHIYNPDRNRPLDLYPILAWMDYETINKYTDIGNVKPRPTFHYRLPNSMINFSKWSLATEWNRWVRVENLAHDHVLLHQLCRDYLELKENTFLGFESNWIKKTEELIDDRI